MSRDEEEDIEIPRRSSDWGPLGPPSNRGEEARDPEERIRSLMQRGRRGGGGSGEQV
jgi:hypothetical protein